MLEILEAHHVPAVDQVAPQQARRGHGGGWSAGGPLFADVQERGGVVGVDGLEEHAAVFGV
ncbi:hypothetical protein, partial [Nonomuraea dietziae]|uniref:hypothetical protein n=1 Tax=Nonomuraea dietziae TaxID=65515 RepID=UPI0033CF91EB